MILPSKVQEFWFSIAEASVPKRETNVASRRPLLEKEDAGIWDLEFRA